MPDNLPRTPAVIEFYNARKNLRELAGDISKAITTNKLGGRLSEAGASQQTMDAQRRKWERQKATVKITQTEYESLLKGIYEPAQRSIGGLLTMKRAVKTQAEKKSLDAEITKIAQKANNDAQKRRKKAG